MGHSRRLAGLLVAVTLAAVVAAPAAARAGDVEKSGTCSVASTWKLSAGPRDGMIRVEFEVDQNVVGQTWRVRLADNGSVFFRGKRTTQAPSGSFSVSRRASDQAGTDRIVARAVNLTTGEVCRGVVRVS